MQLPGHTAGIYSFFTNIIQEARREPEQALCWWETGMVCERHCRVGEQWYNLRPDALAEYRVGSHQMRFWLEWDRGTMNERDLTIKFTSYASYIATREWTREHSMLPVLICVAPDIAQEKRMQRVSPGQPHAFTCSNAVDNHSGVVEGPWASLSYLVKKYSTAQSSGTAERFAQADHLRYGSRKDCLLKRYYNTRLCACSSETEQLGHLSGFQRLSPSVAHVLSLSALRTK